MRELTKNEYELLWLDGLNLSYDAKHEICEIVDEFAYCLHEDVRAVVDRCEKLDAASSDILLKAAIDFSYKKLDKCIAELNCEISTFASSDYPYRLKDIPEPPIVLYYRGNIGILDETVVGINGTRTVSQYGVDVTSHFVRSFIDNDLVILCGISDGIDTIAVQTCLNNAGKCVVVCAGGIDSIVPQINKRLADDVEKSGLVISEQRPSVVPQRFHYVLRNRVLAGLCDASILMEADENSNSLDTVKLAFDYNKEVFAVPGDLSRRTSRAPNTLIAEEYAHCLISPKQVVELFNRDYSFEPLKNVSALDEKDGLLLDLLDGGDMHIESLLEKSGLTMGEIIAKLMLLEAKGLVKKLAGNTYHKIKSMED